MKNDDKPINIISGILTKYWPKWKIKKYDKPINIADGCEVEYWPNLYWPINKYWSI